MDKGLWYSKISLKIPKNINTSILLVYNYEEPKKSGNKTTIKGNQGLIGTLAEAVLQTFFKHNLI